MNGKEWRNNQDCAMVPGISLLFKGYSPHQRSVVDRLKDLKIDVKDKLFSQLREFGFDPCSCRVGSELREIENLVESLQEDAQSYLAEHEPEWRFAKHCRVL